jgi:lysophospholipase L1-like esterase
MPCTRFAALDLGAERLRQGWWCWVLAAAVLWAAANTRVHGATNRWESEIAAFEATDRTNFPPAGGVLFVGSSSIRLWQSLETDFRGVPVVRRGVGGCQLTDVNSFAERLIIPYKPRLVVVYAGDNDIANGRRAADVAEDFRALSTRVLTALPGCRVVFMGIKPCPVRWYAANEVVSANRQIQQLTQSDPRLGFVDVFPNMLDRDGTPRLELFGRDQLHLSRKGYRLWARLVTPHLKAKGRATKKDQP